MVSINLTIKNGYVKVYQFKILKYYIDQWNN